MNRDTSVGLGRGVLVIGEVDQLAVHAGVEPVLRVRAGRGVRPPVPSTPPRVGHAVEIADIDGRAGADLLVVQGCVDGVNVDDLVPLNDGTARDLAAALHAR